MVFVSGAMPLGGGDGAVLLGAMPLAWVVCVCVCFLCSHGHDIMQSGACDYVIVSNVLIHIGLGTCVYVVIHVFFFPLQMRITKKPSRRVIFFCCKSRKPAYTTYRNENYTM